MKSNEILSLEQVSGDASFRKYYRTHATTPPLIIVDAPPQTENSRQFSVIRQMLEQNGLHVPQLLAADFDNGFMIVSDLGDVSYYRVAEDKPGIDDLYSAAISSLLKIQQIDPSGWPIPLYDASFIRRELAIFEEWFVDDLIRVQRFDGFEDLSNCLVESALQQPQVVMHRDYHSRNLMATGSDSPGILDFQDAVLGPVSYDLASLLKDCYLEWPHHFIERSIDEYLQGAYRSGIFAPVDRQQFVRWFDLIALQRHLKCVGIFSRLFRRDQKPDYLQDIPRVMNFIQVTSSKYPELESFHQWLCDVVVPAMDRVPESGGDDL